MLSTLSGVITLGHVACQLGASVHLLAVSCNRCERRGRLRLDDLLAAHGPDLPMPALRRIVAADCARMIEGKMHDVCGVHFPDLSTTFR